MSHGLFVVVHRLLSSCGVQAPGLMGSVVARGFSSCGMWVPERIGSVVVARGLSS